jgi:uncharacterized protein (TIGR00251 family)
LKYGRRNDGVSVAISVRLKPRAGRRAVRVCGRLDLEVSVTSPPVDNRANEQLVEFLADVLGVGKTSLSIIKGGHSRNKVIKVSGMTEADVERALGKIADVQ